LLFNSNTGTWRLTHLFVKVPRPWNREGTFSVFESSCHLLLPVYSFKGKSNSDKRLSQGHNKRTCWFVRHTISLMQNVKQGSCEYQLLGWNAPTNNKLIRELAFLLTPIHLFYLFIYFYLLMQNAGATKITNIKTVSTVQKERQQNIKTLTHVITQDCRCWSNNTEHSTYWWKNYENLWYIQHLDQYTQWLGPEYMRLNYRINQRLANRRWCIRP